MLRKVCKSGFRASKGSVTTWQHWICENTSPYHGVGADVMPMSNPRHSGNTGYQGTHISTSIAIQKVIGTALDSPGTPGADPCVTLSTEPLVSSLKTQ